jgi:hypothetical protein
LQVELRGGEGRSDRGQAAWRVLRTVATPGTDDALGSEPTAMRPEALAGSRVDRRADAGPQALGEKRCCGFKWNSADQGF